MAKQTKSAESGSSTAPDTTTKETATSTTSGSGGGGGGAATTARFVQHPESSSLSEVMLWAQVSASDEGSTSTFQLPELSSSISRPSTPGHDLLSGWLSNYLSVAPQLSPDAATTAEVLPPVPANFMDSDPNLTFDDQLGVWETSCIPDFTKSHTPTLQRWTPSQAPLGAAHDLPPLIPRTLALHQPQCPGEHSGGSGSASHSSWPAVTTTTTHNVAPVSRLAWNSLALVSTRRSWATQFPTATGMAERGVNIQPVPPRREYFHSVGAHSASTSHDQFRGDLKLSNIHAANGFPHPGRVFSNKELVSGTQTQVPLFSAPNYANFATMPGSSTVATAIPSNNFMSQQFTAPAIGSWGINYPSTATRHGKPDQMILPSEMRKLKLATPPPLLMSSMPFRYPKAPLDLNSWGSTPFRYPRVPELQSPQSTGKHLSGTGESSKPSRKRPNPAVGAHSGAALRNRGPRPTFMTAPALPTTSEPVLTLGLGPSGPALNTNGTPRARRGAATDPQSVYAREVAVMSDALRAGVKLLRQHTCSIFYSRLRSDVVWMQSRRVKINERVKILQALIPNGTKVDIVTMLDEAQNYVKFLEKQIELLKSDEKWQLATLSSYKGLDHSRPQAAQMQGPKPENSVRR